MAHTILIADDDPDILALCALYLKELGQVIAARDGRAALALPRTGVLAVIDIMMPEMNGYQLISEIGRAHWRPSW